MMLTPARLGFSLTKETVVKVLVGMTSLVNPEASLTQRRQALPLGVQIIATDNFDKVSDQDLDGAELVPLV
jgi:hypothetical protein